MRVAAVQHDIVWEDAAATCARLAGPVAAAAAAGAELVVLSEMFATGFVPDGERVAEPEGGPTSRWLAEQAAEHGVWVGGSVAERPAGGERPRNQLVLAGPGGEVVRYAKVHPFSYAGEQHHYEAGTELVVASVAGLRLGLFVCYDLRFADEFWTLAPEVDGYVVVANWPAARRHHWRSLLVARAIENQAYVIGVNRVGEGGGLAYAGDSMVVDPSGEVLGSAAGGPALVVCDLDPGVVTSVRSRFPFLADRRRGGDR